MGTDIVVMEGGFAPPPKIFRPLYGKAPGKSWETAPTFQHISQTQMPTSSLPLHCSQPDISGCLHSPIESPDTWGLMAICPLKLVSCTEHEIIFQKYKKPDPLIVQLYFNSTIKQ